MCRMLFNSHTLMLYVPTIYLSVTRYYAHILFTYLYKLEAVGLFRSLMQIRSQHLSTIYKHNLS